MLLAAQRPSPRVSRPYAADVLVWEWQAISAAARSFSRVPMQWLAPADGWTQHLTAITATPCNQSCRRQAGIGGTGGRGRSNTTSSRMVPRGRGSSVRRDGLHAAAATAHSAHSTADSTAEWEHSALCPLSSTQNVVLRHASTAAAFIAALATGHEDCIAASFVQLAALLGRSGLSNRRTALNMANHAYVIEAPVHTVQQLQRPAQLTVVRPSRPSSPRRSIRVSCCSSASIAGVAERCGTGLSAAR